MQPARACRCSTRPMGCHGSAEYALRAHLIARRAEVCEMTRASIALRYRAEASGNRLDFGFGSCGLAVASANGWSLGVTGFYGRAKKRCASNSDMNDLLQGWMRFKAIFGSNLASGPRNDGLMCPRAVLAQRKSFISELDAQITVPITKKAAARRAAALKERCVG